MTELPLGNLTREDGLSYLENQKVAPQVHEQLLATSHGHPLALSMLADAVHRGTVPSSLDTVPEVVRALLERMIDEVPSPQHARALEVCAYAPATTEDLLSAVLGEAAVELFAWLRALPFIEEGPRGLFPHDVVRDVLDADLLWRNPVDHAELGREVTRAMHSRLLATEDEREQLAFLVDQIVLSGRRSRAETCSTPPPTLQAYVDDLKADDHESILAMTSHWHGPEQAGLVAYWLRRAPHAFRVFRTPAGAARGYAACLELTGSEFTDGDDVGADVMWQQAQARPGERVRAWRFFLDRDHGQDTSPSVTLFAACQVLDAITHPDVAYSLVGAYTDAARWTGTMANLDFWPVTEFSVGQHTFTVFAHDWRLVGREGWSDRMRAQQAGSAVRPMPEEDRVLLSRNEFIEAVRSALAHLNDPGHLQENPLLRSRVTKTDDASPVAALRHLLHEAVLHLPPDLKIVAEQTYLHPTTTQQRIAQSLHLSFNTYRRRRDQATAEITEWPWQRETLQDQWVRLAGGDRPSADAGRARP